MLRRTKIIATLGPGIDDKDILSRAISAGIDLVRLNMSHGEHGDHLRRINWVRDISKSIHKEIGIILDLQGPKIRIGEIPGGVKLYSSDEEIILDTNPCNISDDVITVDYPMLGQEVKIDDELLLDDGKFILQVIDVTQTRITCKVQHSGYLSSYKGINKRGGGLSIAAITKKDLQDIEFAKQNNVDYVALSFVKGPLDVIQAKQLLNSTETKIKVISKIERTEAVYCLEDIIEASDAVMVARGDLAIELGFAELPAVQKLIINKANAIDRAVITATQMMESMIDNPTPTRAEVSDVANAIIDGTDAVMLSAETAIGKYPVQVINTMHSVCLAAEKQPVTQVSSHRLESTFTRIDEAIAMAAMYTANHFPVAAIIAITETGSTPLWMSRIQTGIPIYGVSQNKYARRHMTLYKDVYPIDFDLDQHKSDLISGVLSKLRNNELIKTGDHVVITQGDLQTNSGANMVKILIV